VLSSIITRFPSPLTPESYSEDSSSSNPSRKFAFITGANDDQIKVWEVEPPTPRKLGPMALITDSDVELGDCGNETMIYALSKFVSIPSVSNSLAHREDCRQAAIWLRKCFTQLGAEASLVRRSPVLLYHAFERRSRCLAPHWRWYQPIGPCDIYWISD